ncbi:MAG: serine/threonine protein kinase, partial [Planctomycetaceae bacterium]|nr:serine/threonine protein kinase [Planctomycetaceae bacterium]
MTFGERLFVPTYDSCPADDDLELLLLGRTDDDRAGELEKHLDGCAACRSRLIELGAEDELVAALRAGQPNPLGQEATTGRGDQATDLAGLLIPQFKRIAGSPHGSAGGTQTFVEGSTPVPHQLDSTFSSSTKSAAFTDEVISIGPYEIRGVVGRGGMGTVFHAYDPRLKRSVALKVIQQHWSADPEAVDRLVREAQAAAAVEHDNIVVIHAIETHDGLPCIVMPLLRGENIRQRVEALGGPMSLSEILRIGQEVAGGLSAAHANGLVHRDLKPENLWLEEPSGRARILDFGLAEFRDGQSSGGQTISGTPGYLAPEQAKGLPCDARSDIFSLGCVLYYLATGKPPFTGSKEHRALWTVLSDPPAAAATCNPNVPDELSDLITRMLSQDPADRPSSAQEVFKLLQAVEGLQAAARLTGVRRRRMLVVAAAALMGGIAVGAWTLVPPTPVTVIIQGDEPSMPIVFSHEATEHTLQIDEAETHTLAPGRYSLRPAQPQDGRTLLPDHLTIEPGDTQTVR